MATARFSPPWHVLPIALLITLVISCHGDTDESSDEKVYIVYMGDRPKGEISTTEQHRRLLHATLGSDRAAESWLHSYKRSFNGFVAKLTEDERKKIAGMEEVVSVFPNTKSQLHTTRSWDFIGFPLNIERAQLESDVIVGVIDSGIWPESQSFSDEGLSPPPAKWKGSCNSSSNFTCNNKIIGAKYYSTEGFIFPPDVQSPRDTDGHGTHTASTAAGCTVSGASLYGLRPGTARGGVPSARIAVYKVCYADGCGGADILAAFDDAIADGVDIISISIGGSTPTGYKYDPIAIGAFHAMKNGILTSTSAGNTGPGLGTITNVSPWSLSVAASTTDRKFRTQVKLGNGKSYEGVTVNTFTLEEQSYPLVYGGNVPNTADGYNGSSSMFCLPGSLDRALVNGTIILCQMQTETDERAGGATGVIFYTQQELSDFAQIYLIPTSFLGGGDGHQVFHYIDKTSDPRATIFKSTEVDDPLAPLTASFSSRGPNPISHEILKPDLSAPGVDILAAYSEATTVTGNPDDTRIVPYNIISGTSMACPHASGAAAYVKSFNPTWSPAAIKSALMTTATSMDTNANDTVLMHGSGSINPLKAKSPGLVYDMGVADYVNFLCGQGYDKKSLQLVTGDNTACTEAASSFKVYDLNYPSFTVSFNSSNGSIGAVFHRTVTNVGSPSSTYKAVLAAADARLSIHVEPSTLSFTSLGEKQTFVVTVNATISELEMASGSLVWDDGMHQVRSPVVVYHFPGSTGV